MTTNLKRDISKFNYCGGLSNSSFVSVQLPRFKFVALIVVLLALLTGCNAFRGLGKDIEKVGEAIQRS